MFKKNMKGAVFALIAAATLTGTVAPVFAADNGTTFKNSTASEAIPSQSLGWGGSTFISGQDESQGVSGKETGYDGADPNIEFGGSGASTESVERSVNVYATKASSVTICVPQILIGDTQKCSYRIGVKGDVTTKQSVTVAPKQTTFTLTDKNDSNHTVNATIDQKDTTWACSDIGGPWNYKTGSISYNIKAGQYTGSFNFDVKLNYTK